jgi:hypothetical protein
MDELELLQQVRPVDPPSPVTVTRARNALLRLAEDPRPATHARRFPLRGRILLPVAAGALAILSVGLAAIHEVRSERSGVHIAFGPVGTSPDETAAQRLLLTAAERSRNEPAPGRGTYWVAAHERGQLIEVGEPGSRYAITGRTIETWWNPRVRDRDAVMISRWAGAAPATSTDRAAWRKAGSPDSWVKDVPEGCPPDPSDTWTSTSGAPAAVRRDSSGPLFEVLGQPLTTAQVLALPSDPDALQDWLMTVVTDQDLPRATADEVARSVFDAVVNLLFETPATPAVRAAAYQVLARVPGVRSLGAVTDTAGRTGVAISIDRNNTAEEQRADPGGPTEMRVLFDPASGRTLSLETRVIRPADYLSWVPAGALFAYDRLDETRWTDDKPPELRYAGEAETDKAGVRPAC